MPLKLNLDEAPSLNLTSMIDVLFLLIIFFMVGTRFSEEERQTNIQVPTAAGATALSGAPDEIVVNVAEDGQVFVKGELQTVESLKTMLQAAQQGYPNQIVVIRGDGRCVYQQIMDAFSTCKDAGIRNISVAHLPRK